MRRSNAYKTHTTGSADWRDGSNKYDSVYVRV